MLQFKYIGRENRFYRGGAASGKPQDGHVFELIASITNETHQISRECHVSLEVPKVLLEWTLNLSDPMRVPNEVPDRATRSHRYFRIYASKVFPGDRLLLPVQLFLSQTWLDDAKFRTDRRTINLITSADFYMTDNFVANKKGDIKKWIREDDGVFLNPGDLSLLPEPDSESNLDE